MKLSRAPRSDLRPFITLLWASEPDTHLIRDGGRRELVLPTGAAHVVLRLKVDPVRLCSDLDDFAGRAVGTSLIGGARATAYLKKLADPVPAVGAMLRPGAVDLLSGAPSVELAGKHTRLEDLLPGSAVPDLIDALRNMQTLSARMDQFEAFLCSRLAQARAIHPVVAHAVRRFDACATLREVAMETGFSVRHLRRTFTQWVGLTPKSYGRVRRFGKALRQMHAAPFCDLAQLAVEAGYADQAHMTREVRAFSGVTPIQYIRISPRDSHHLPIFEPECPISSIQSCAKIA